MNHKNNALSRSLAVAGALAAGLGILMAGGEARAQSLTVLPVNVVMTSSQMATSLTVINQGTSETSVQLRAFTWKQTNGAEELAPTTDVQLSPPIVTIAPGATQVVRLVLRRAAKGSESTYRILLDQIPPAAEAGMVRIALRLSIPVFVAPAGRAVAKTTYRVENKDGVATLVAVNTGTRHDTLRDVTLNSGAGSDLKAAANASPYILAGATRSWPIAAGTTGALPLPGARLQMSAVADAGLVSQSLTVVGAP